ncbi:uncharacterized protein EI97DRAFT_390635 [Westerdykella ornata]|uniref:Utp8 beta-propeller domain-containing protein n=1 Tax=Westerdykella ornata TaxID=318751 RepID=A0A6A6JUP9_WESOR|nr:uncharacterized protein EI97DRAFT_390635 [Westerdykella ornata]KAF2279944.1 hypothetical protein EI97DRAFT_390635 [Westerdykella ornata]
MSSETRIGAAFVLASLPRPGSSSSGRTQAACVYSIGGAKKKQRSEVAVGIDGEGISVYSLQNPQLVTSYALPPETSFTSPPHSLYRKQAHEQRSVRSTYAATRIPSGDGLNVVCFTEETHRDGTSDTVKTSYVVRRSGDDILAIESITQHGSADTNGSHDVLIVFSSGHLLCLSSDLGTTRWEADLRQLTDKRTSGSAFKIEYVTVATAKAAVNGLLRGRQDIAAILDPSLEGKSKILALTPVLCAIFSFDGQPQTLALFQLQPRSPDLISTRLSPVKHLHTWILPSTETTAAAETAHGSYNLDTPSGTLYHFTKDRILSYNFSGTVPELDSDLQLLGSGLSSFLPISTDLILAPTENALGLYGLKYGSVQSILPWERTEASNDSKKRKLDEGDGVPFPQTVPSLVCYFAESGLAVGIANQELVGIELVESPARKRVRANDAFLVGAVGKAVRSGPIPTSSADTSDWEKRLQKLEKYFSKGKVADFERQYAAHLHIEFADTASSTEGDGTSSHALVQNGTSPQVSTEDGTEELKITELRKWVLPESISDSQKDRFRHCAAYALRKIFRYVKRESSGGLHTVSPLKIQFFPPNLFQWLLLSGFITKECIHHAFTSDGANELGTIGAISDGDIVTAIVDFDPELHILSAVLSQPSVLPIGDVVQAIRILMQNLDDRPVDRRQPGFLINGTSSKDDEMDVELASEFDAAAQDLDRAMSLLDEGLLIRSHNLQLALMRLHSFPASDIVSTLRSKVPRREQESLIRLLHSELRNGGWTSQYNLVDADTLGADSWVENPEDQAVAIIASLLGCALDAIGAGAWLGSIGDSGSEEATEDMIQDLVHDTSEALNGFWEARYMRGLLSEFLRYASNLSKSQKPTSQTLQKQGKPFTEDVPTDDVLPMLPLGCKVDLGVEKTKPAKGGRRKERSAREIGLLISKRVPKYSLERIVI